MFYLVSSPLVSSFETSACRQRNGYSGDFFSTARVLPGFSLNMVSTGPAGKILLFVTDFTINHAVITCSDIVVERCVGEGEGGQYHSHAVVLLQGGVSLYHAQGARQGLGKVCYSTYGYLVKNKIISQFYLCHEEHVSLSLLVAKELPEADAGSVGAASLLQKVLTIVGHAGQELLRDIVVKPVLHDHVLGLPQLGDIHPLGAH